MLMASSGTSLALVVPASYTLKIQLLEQRNTLPAVGDPSTAKTYNILLLRYFWVNMHDDIAWLLLNYLPCSYAKASHQKPQDLSTS